MIPASLAGIFFLSALVPGWLFLAITSSHRRPGVRTSAIQEFVTLVAVGVAVMVPTLIAVAMTCPGVVSDQVMAWRSVTDLSTHDVRQGGLLAATVVVGSLGLSLIMAGAYVALHPERSSESAWHTVLWQDKTDTTQLNWVEVEMKDGRLIAGVIHSYDAEPVGEHRDLVLQAPLRYTFTSGKRRTFPSADRVIIADDEIRTITVQHVENG